ncbi:MAG: YMGG-like Gly-zipper [Candidatus Dependentiae bacterium]|nr:YMGG-like Gly-zipper [Candidatus Dependentiae bacterium]
MKNMMIRLAMLVSVAGALSFMGGCTDKQKKGAVIGTILGAGLGAGIGGLIGKNAGSAIAGAAIGGVALGGAGAVIGSNEDTKECTVCVKDKTCCPCKKQGKKHTK